MSGAAEKSRQNLSVELMTAMPRSVFLRESELVACLKHRHVVRTSTRGRHSGRLLFLVMPLLQGRDLDRVLESSVRWSQKTRSASAMQAARGLAARIASASFTETQARQPRPG